MIIAEEKQVKEVLSMEKCCGVMRQAFLDLEAGKCVMPLRSIGKMPNGALLGFMPAAVGDYFGGKVIVAYGANAGTEYPTHLGYVMLFEKEHCTVVGLVDASSITEIRTGCVSAVATDALARKDAHTVAIIGAGVQGRSHLEAVCTVRKITSATVYDLLPAAAEKYAAEMSAKLGIPVTVCASPAGAVADADIICTVCPAKEPYLFQAMVKPGVHINAVGTFSPTTREVGSDLIAASRLYSDQTAAMKAESGEYLIPLKEGLIRENHVIGSLGELLAGKVQGRVSESDITVFDALGLAVEDIAAAAAVYEALK